MISLQKTNFIKNSFQSHLTELEDYENTTYKDLMGLEIEVEKVKQ